jgi:cysteine desulfurase
METIYLDHNASAPLDPAVLDAMQPYWLASGNSDSQHAVGRTARRALLQTTEVVGRILGARPEEVVFTSGGTEGNNLAVFGVVRSAHTPAHIVTTALEHPAVSEPIASLARHGYEVTSVPVMPSGLATVDQMITACRADTVLATLMLAQNETGAIQPVASLVSGLTSTNICVHTDASQAVGRIPVDFHKLGVTTLASSGHKFHGPVGVGVLLIRSGTMLAQHVLGGSQQAGRRAGTVPVALAVGFAAALELWDRDHQERIQHWRALRNQLEFGLVQGLGRDFVVRHGPLADDDRLPQTLQVGFPGLDGNSLLMQLDLAGVAASLGSACASGSTQPSPALRAMGVPEELVRSSVRFSLGAQTTNREIEEAIARTVTVVKRLQCLQPASTTLS